jgi:hypothetical protein
MFSADIMMEKVTINVQIPYMMELSSFVTEALTPPVTMETPAGGGYSPVPVPTENDSEEGPVITVYFSISQPEIVLLADPETQNSRIIVVNVSIHSNHLYIYLSSLRRLVFLNESALMLFLMKMLLNCTNLGIHVNQQ